ncbi:hypothetical protein F7725_014701 [Dissostichus mawsoni]|uniref:Uncharacterized protein n=1 Tax=Dissostichus mawsoni TaxID=36200 RepID=A0A7J5YXS0_DISMA|nr:hypothetical protein F7725_014701 [Dissostichus mawsoni]
MPCVSSFHSLTFSHACVYAAPELDVNLCQEEVTTESSGEFLTPCRHGRGSCLRTLEPLKGSVSSAMKTVLRSYTDVCDAVNVVDIGLRFLGKAGGDPQGQLLTYLTDSLQMEKQISSTVAKALGESKLEHSISTWQLLTSWKSELMLSRKQDPFQKLPTKFQKKLSEDERKGLKVFLAATDVETFCLELHEILLLKINHDVPDEGYQAHWE